MLEEGEGRKGYEIELWFHPEPLEIGGISWTVTSPLQGEDVWTLCKFVVRRKLSSVVRFREDSLSLELVEKIIEKFKELCLEATQPFSVRVKIGELE